MKNYSFQDSDKLQQLVQEPDAMYHISISRVGLAVSYLQEFINYSKITLKELSAIFQVSERTIQRYQSDKRLPSGPSEKLIALTKLYDFGSQVLGSTSDFREWMHASNMSLGGAKPIDLLDTHMGFQLVQDALGRLAHGVYS